MKEITFDDILLVPSFNDIASRKDVSLSVVDSTGRISLDLPVFSSNMDTVTGSEMAAYMRSKGGMGVLHRFMTIEENVAEYLKFTDCFVSIGTNSAETDRLFALRDAGARQFCVDVAHGHSAATGQMVQLIRKNIPDSVIIAGNVCTLEGANYLAEAGADIIKVGIGPSPVCRTRGATGFGYPQLSAVRNCARVDRSIISDGGIKTPGAIVKALAFGADFVMLGSMFAGTHYTPGEIHQRDEVEHLNSKMPLSSHVKKYRGMASREANEDMFGSLATHKTFEGVGVTVPYKSPEETDLIMQDIAGGVRSGLTYCGARTIKELRSKFQYIEVSSATVQENKTLHD